MGNPLNACRWNLSLQWR